MSNWFKDRREELDMSQFDLAVKAGITPGTVSCWERYRLIPKTSIAKLAELYQAPTSVIERQLIVQRREVEKRAELVTAAKD